MPRDAEVSLSEGQWSPVTDGAVTNINIIQNQGSNPCYFRWDSTTPTADPRDPGIWWETGRLELEMGSPEGASLTAYAFPIGGPGLFYVKHP